MNTDAYEDDLRHAARAAIHRTRRPTGPYSEEDAFPPSIDNIVLGSE